MAEFDPQNRPLEAFHAVVKSAQCVMILSVLTPVAQHANCAFMFGIAGGYRATFAVSAKILAGVKTEARHIPNTARRQTFIFGAVGLRGVFNYDKSVPPRNFHDRIHVGRLTVEVHGQYGLGARSDRRLDGSRVHRERAGLDIDQDRPRPGVEHCGNAGDKGKWHRDDFIVRSNSRGEQGEMNRTRAGIQSDALCSCAIRSELFFKGSNLSAEHKLAALKHSCNGLVDFWFDVVVLGS